MQLISEKLKKYLRTFPKKHHVEYLSALLSIPVLLTVIILNYSNIQGSKNKETAPTPAPEKIIIQTTTQPVAKDSAPQPTSSMCKKEVGPISISSPTEGQTVSENPVNIIISYKNTDYCSVVWSYRINGGEWSAYTSNNPSLYNLPTGNTKFELRVQSTVSQDSDTLDRNFIYKGGSTVTPTPSPSPTISPTVTATP